MKIILSLQCDKTGLIQSTLLSVTVRKHVLFQYDKIPNTEYFIICYNDLKVYDCSMIVHS